MTLYRDGEKGEDLMGEVLAFPTHKGETIVVIPIGVKPSVITIP